MTTIKGYVSNFLEENTYIVEDGGSLYLIDPGYGLEKTLSDEINGRELYIVVTHAHIDHIAGISRQPSALSLYIHPLDRPALFDDRSNLSFLVGEGFPGFPEDRIKEITDLPANWRVIHTPGHTGGSVCLLLNDEYLFTGDTLFTDSIGRTDFPGGDPAAMKGSISAMKTLLRNNLDLLILPGHGRSARAGRVIELNPYLK